MKTWLGIALIAVFSVAMTRIALRYLSYLEIACLLGAIAVLLVLANIVVDRWRSRNERRLAVVLLSLDIAQRQAALGEIPRESRERVLMLMKQISANDGTDG
jgi:hypothetical protein